MSHPSKTAAFLDTFATRLQNDVKKFKGGPQTPEGKTASARNATKHGLTSSTVIVPGEDAEAYGQQLRDLRIDHRPRTAIEEQCIEQLAQAHWKIIRCAKLETALWDVELGAATAATSPFHKMAVSFLKGSNIAAALDKITRYQAEARRAFHQAEGTLRRHQRYAHDALQMDKKRALSQQGEVAAFGLDAVAFARFVEIANRAKSPETNSAAALAREKPVH